MFIITTITGYENQQLFNAASKKFDDVRVINPDNIFWSFGTLVNIWYQNKPIVYSEVDGCIIRSHSNSKAVLGKYLATANCKNVDPVERFVTSGIPKMHSELMRQFSVGENMPVSHFAFNYETLYTHRDLIGFYPLVYKPVQGAHGRDMKLVTNQSELLNVARTHYFSKPIFFQQYITAEKEYRAIMYNGKIINIAEKVLKEKKLFSGRKFVKVESIPYGMIKYLEFYAKRGLVGIDIIIDKNENYVILEQNRAPEFEHIDNATGLNTAQLIMDTM
ncbi:MAG: hypothetical protein HC874_30405 [Richelia sp. SL_2_1]|nr:hypothetical protein [Richelia sp. SL_2_1]